MATKSVTTIERADSVLELWAQINQLEAVLDAANLALSRYCGEDDETERMSAVNDAHGLLGAAQTVADSLARAAGVR